MSRSTAFVCLMSAALLFGGCRLVAPLASYPPLGAVARIEVKTGSIDGPMRVIDDPAEVARVVAFVDERRGGWGGSADWVGVPVPQVSADFYSGSEFLGHFGVGPGFFECHRKGSFASQSCTESEERHFLELLGLPDHNLRK